MEQDRDRSVGGPELEQAYVVGAHPTAMRLCAALHGIGVGVTSVATGPGSGRPEGVRVGVISRESAELLCELAESERRRRDHAEALSLVLAEVGCEA